MRNVSGAHPTGCDDGCPDHDSAPTEADLVAADAGEAMSSDMTTKAAMERDRVTIDRGLFIISIFSTSLIYYLVLCTVKESMSSFIRSPTQCVSPLYVCSIPPQSGYV